MADLDDWRVFVTVGTLRSFINASRALRRSPQAVTRAVSALERRLGLRLLHRTTRSVALTGEGARLLEQGRRVLHEFDLLESPRAADAPLTGSLSITAPVLFGQLRVVPVVARLLGLHPALSVRLLLLDRPVSLIDEGIDVAIRIGSLPDSSLQATKVGAVGVVTCASPAYLEQAGVPRAPEDLTGRSCIAFTGTSPALDRWSFTRPGQRTQHVPVRPRLFVNTGQAAIDAALCGLGIIRVLSYQVEALVAAGRLVTVLRAFEPEPVPVSLVRLPGPTTQAQAAFLAAASSELRVAPMESPGPARATAKKRKRS